MHAVPRSGVLAPFSSVHVSVRFTIKRAGVYREKIPLWIPEVSALYPAGTPPFHAVEVEAIGRGPAVHTSTNTLEFGLLELGKETHTSFTVTNDNPIPVVVQLLDPSPPSYPPSDTTEAGAPLPAPLPPRYVFLPPTFSLFPGDAMEVTVYRRAVVLEDGRGFFEIHTPHGGVMVMETRATIQEPTLMVEEAVLNFGVVPEGVWQDGAFYVSNPTALENPVQVRVASPYSNYLELEVQEPHLLIRAGEPHAAVKVRARFQYHPREEAKRRRKQQKDEEARRKRRRQEEALEKARQKRAAAAAAAEEEEEDEEEGVNSAVNGTTGGSTEGEGSGVEAGGTGGGAHTTNSNTSILEKGDEKKAGRSDGTRRSFTPSFHAVTEAANWEDVFSSPDAVGKGSEEKEPRRRQKKENTFSPATSTTIVATNTTEQEEEEDNEDTVIPHYYQGLIAVESMKNHQVLLVEVCCDRVERLTVSVDMAEIKPHAHPTMQASTTLLKYFLPLVPPARNTALTAAAAAATATFPPSPSPYRSIEKSTGSLGKSHLGRSSIKGEFLLATSPGAAAAAAVAAKRPPFLSSALSPAAANDPGRPLLSTHRTRHGKRDGQRPCSSGRAVSLHSPRSPLEALPPFSPPLKKGLPGIKDPAAWRMTLAYAADWGEAPLEFFFHSFLWNLIDHRVLPIADARAARRLARRRHRRRRRRRRLCRLLASRRAARASAMGSTR